MTPYRSPKEVQKPRDTPQTGLVAEMVRQFADTFAFVRELVQNGIDAGASAIEVAVDRLSDGVTSVRVADDGCGMTEATIESALLVLFRSTKDEDPTKIGKYGVGFMSVLAIDPSEVTIDTWRDGTALRVRLFPDHSYEIERSVPRDGHGTTVAVTKTVADEHFEAFWYDVTEALHRWCRHAELPIHFTLIDGVSEEPRRARADRPFDVRSIVSVRHAFEDGMEIVLGPIAGSAKLPASGSGEDAPAPFAGFYNRGLTLYETPEALSDELAHVRVKVKSAKLTHTLSRDDVRRDRAFLVSIARAVGMCSELLPGAVLAELKAECQNAATEEPAPRLGPLIEAALASPVSIPPDKLPLPLAHPIGGALVMTAERMHELYSERLGLLRYVVLSTTERTALTKSLAKRGVPVAWLATGEIVSAVGRIGVGSPGFTPVTGECLLARELSENDKLPGDDVLCRELAHLFSRVNACRVAFGTLVEDQTPIGVVVPAPKQGAKEHVVLARALKLPLPKWPAGSLIILNTANQIVEHARNALSPAIGAHLLARYLLLLGPGLSSRMNEQLAIFALEQIR